ncbi:NAD-dependent epimerase/dehydratase family protein [Alginatibacterium sediminis]|uniref:NAD-dependent epimerase/dehydratase family protein n=1 Tax=Alginatibacterium sediminis TaxID=2164068 RepID=A0A420EHV3_9ALTE|nr:NAD-dependent epimerase/dehydratase family protein [Alginatibacterium sediminis]RKF20237.1 NAD-dependent epimerase/dehydratase family protein [Alginatibacterium sediminis]
MKETVFVTGANGHIGYQVCKQLIEKGYQVIALVRDLEHRDYSDLKALNVQLRDGDCLNLESLAQGMQGCDYVIHLAAIFDNSINEIDAIVKPNLAMTENVMRVAKRKSVKRVVCTSSIVAIGGADIGSAPLSNEVYNTHSSQLYSRSKAIAEQAAWKLAQELDVNLATVLPASVIGPYHGEKTDSIEVIDQLLKGKIPFALPMHFSYVDVRDVAAAHILVMESDLKQRFVAASFDFDAKSLIAQIKQHRKIKVSEKELPIWLCQCLPVIDWLSAKLTGSKRLMTRSTVEEYIGKQQRYSDRALYENLNWKTISTEQTIVDTIEALESS